MSSETATQSTLSSEFLNVRRLTDLLSSRLSAEDQTAQSMPSTSPTKWHRAHTTWFFEEFVLRPLPDYVVYDPGYRYLFNSYYETVGERHPRPQRGLITRPGINDIARYREHVDAEMVRAVDGGDLDQGARAVLELGLHHEQQHQELLLMDIKHLLSIHPEAPPYVDAVPSSDPEQASPLEWRVVPGGLKEIGHEGDGFSYDNERARHTVWLEDFSITRRAITNSQWLEFIADDGYRRPELWLSDGWAAVQRNSWSAPGYWSRDTDDAWTVFTLAGRRRLDLAEPVCHISFYEADAFARWAGARLPTEFEWETAAHATFEQRGQLLDANRAHPGHAVPAMIGDVWEWTASAYLPYPGFRPEGGALGEYNGKFMSDQHVLRGASAVTPPGHERITYRNFFPADARWAFSGLRLAR